MTNEHDALIIAEGQRDQARAERDALRDQWSGLLIEQARLMALRDEAIAERDALREQAEAAEAERDVLAEKWGDMVDDHGDPLDASGILEYVCTLREELSHMKAERDKLRTVYKAAAVYCGDRTVANAHALIDAVGEIRALAVQPTTSTGETQ